MGYVVDIPSDRFSSAPPRRADVPAEPDPIEAAAWFLAAQPGAVERTLRAHARRADGRCDGCGQLRQVWWPCVLVNIALRAQLLRGGSGAVSFDETPQNR